MKEKIETIIAQNRMMSAISVKEMTELIISAIKSELPEEDPFDNKSWNSYRQELLTKLTK